MFSTKMNGFCKNENCPSSLELLEYANGDMPRGRGSEVNRHLTSCEFCSAEVEFYTHYPQADPTVESTEPAEIPAPLFELAEALLKNRHTNTDSLDLLLKEKEPLTLEGVS